MVIFLVLVVCVGITVAYVASVTSLLPGIEFRYATNGRTGEPMSLFSSFIFYGFIWLIFNTLVWCYFTIAVSLAGAVLKRCGYKQEVDKLQNRYLSCSPCLRSSVALFSFAPLGNNNISF